MASIKIPALFLIFLWLFSSCRTEMVVTEELDLSDSLEGNVIVPEIDDDHPLTDRDTTTDIISREKSRSSIRSIQLYPTGSPSMLPIITLGGDEKLVLSF